MTDDELNRAVAEEVMGWRRETVWQDDPRQFDVWIEDDGTYYGKRRRVDSEDWWSPATRWDHAGTVLEKMRRKGWGLEVLAVEEHVHFVPLTVRGVQRTPPVFFGGDEPGLLHAICQAALAAVRSEK